MSNTFTLNSYKISTKPFVGNNILSHINVLSNSKANLTTEKASFSGLLQNGTSFLLVIKCIRRRTQS